VNIDNCQIYDNKVFVMWNWTWLDESLSDGEDSSDENVAELSDEHNDEHDDDDTDNSIPAITHSVVFKCMGSTKEHEYEEATCLAKKKVN